jgi:7-cyano-7-deazaguanine synthase
MNTIVLFSGGVDSGACAHYLAREKHEVHPLFVDYGQRAAIPEATAAHELSRALGLTLHTAKFSTAHSFGAGEIKGRNAFLVFSAILSTVYVEPCNIALGIHAGTPYYDCTSAFIESIDRLVAEQSDGSVRVVAPFLSWSKRNVYEYFVESKLPIELTYSCEAGEVPSCGLCLSCRDRKRLI